uniref:Raftlin, lipid raft linker 1a n=1 Tax=Myripristis murdjan TaxID=586833 RepID=A0A667WXI4_9TELE
MSVLLSYISSLPPSGGTSTLRLSSVRELPGQLQELYQQGFILAAVHPFIHPCGPESNSPQHQLYRAILCTLNAKKKPISDEILCQIYCNFAACPCSQQQIQDAADQGVMFVGFVQEPYGAPPRNHGEPAAQGDVTDTEGNQGLEAPHEAGEGAPGEEQKPSENIGNHAGTGGERGQDELSSAASPVSEGDLEHSEDLTEDDSMTHNNNKANGRETKERPRYRLRRGNGEWFPGLSSSTEPKTKMKTRCIDYYTVKVPLRVQNRDEGVKGVEANWLDHMTQHFNNGASLVDGYFHLGNENDLLPKSVESVFIFQEATESELSAANPTYDAIVVEQWTVIDGLQVKADYVPLLQSLATFGWRLTCVLPTPVIKTNSDGSLSTKQIVFLQRPVLSRKRRESKVHDLAFLSVFLLANVGSPRRCSLHLLILDERENVEKEEAKSRDERANTTEVGEACKEGETAKESEAKSEGDGKIDDGIEIGVENDKIKDGGAEKRDQGAENGTGEDGEEEKPTQERMGSRENGEHLENGDVEEVTETVVTVETERETKDEENEGGVRVEAVLENGLDTEETKEEAGENATKPEKEDPAGVEAITKEVVAGAQVPPANQSVEETQE